MLQAAGATVHLAHPLGVKGFRYRRVKNDVRDAADLADLLRMGRLPEAWIAPPETRELRELVRYRAKLVAIRSGLKAQVHAVLAKAGVLIAVADLFGVTGRQRLAKVALAPAYAQRIRSLLELIDILDGHVARFAAMIAERLDTHRGYHAIQHVPGIGPVLAAVFVAEIGDVHRFADPAQLCSWAGLTPRHHESDTVVRRGHITKQGSNWCAGRPWRPSSASPTPPRSPLDRQRIEARRGNNIAKIAAARKLLTLVYYGLRDGHIRAVAHRQRRREHLGRSTRAVAQLSDPRTSAWSPVLIDPACCTRTAPCPLLRGEGMTGSRRFGPAPTHTHHCGDVAPQPHSRCSSTPTSTQDALNLSAPSSRSFVLAALRALHLDTGVGSALSTSRSKQLKTPLTTPRPFRDDNCSRRGINTTACSCNRHERMCMFFGLSRNHSSSNVSRLAQHSPGGSAAL